MKYVPQVIFFLFLGSLPSGGIAEEQYKVLEPAKSKHLRESAHFVARWNDSDEVKLSDADLKQGLETLESMRDFYLGKVGFPAPYKDQAEKYKINANLSNKGWANGSGTGKNDPAMWLHFNAFKDKHALAHEFAHCLQFGSMGLRDSRCVGWFWESHAEWMTHQMFPDNTGCSDQMVNAPHLYYGSTRNRYGNWQFWEYIKDKYGYEAINDIWNKSRRPDDKDRDKEDPILVLARNRGWTISELNDQFGAWAMHNVTWDYKNGEVYRKSYGSYTNLVGIRRNRVSILDPLDPKSGRYLIPDYRAPQRFGYNLVMIEPDAANRQRTFSVQFRGLVQKEPGVAAFDRKFEKEPANVQNPASDWRWGLVAVDEKGRPRYSDLQRGAVSQLNFQMAANEKELWLVVTATPSEYQRVEWDQMYYTIYRYPWMVEIRGGYPKGSEKAPFTNVAGRKGAPHPNGGGWVDSTAHVDPSAFVGTNAKVLESAQVLGKARVEGQAIVSGKAQVKDNAVVCGHAIVTGNGIVGGNARIENEATVSAGTVDEDARIGALTLVEGSKTKIHGKAQVRAVMNKIRNFELSGTVQLLGDIELRTPLSEGVFYGMITPEMAKSQRWGAKRTEPAREVTAVPKPAWLP